MLMRSHRASDGLVMKTMIRMRMMIPEKTLLTVDRPRDARGAGSPAAASSPEM
jgi:hypothetical protein